LLGLGLVFQVLRGDWAAAMPYFWRSFGLAEAVEESGDLYGRSEIHRAPRLLVAAGPDGRRATLRRQHP
jgi:hypothetical protein